MKYVASLFVLAVALSSAPALVAQDKKATQTAPKEATDPVCGMTVDPKAADKSVYKGKTYYFCSRSDKETFDKAPAKYAETTGDKKK